MELSGCVLEHPGIFWNIPVAPVGPARESIAIIWNILEHSRTLWNIAQMMRVIDTWAQATPTTRARMRAFIIVFSSSGTGCYQASLYSQGLGEVGRAEVVQTSRLALGWDEVPGHSRMFQELPGASIMDSLGLGIFQNFLECFKDTRRVFLRS